jgi:hypothetical protein
LSRREGKVIEAIWETCFDTANISTEEERKRKTNKRLAARFIYRLERESAGNPKRQCNPTRRIYTHKHVHTHTHTQAAQESKVERETGQTQTAAFAVAATCKLLTTLL